MSATRDTERIIAGALLWHPRFADATVGEVRTFAATLADALEHPEQYQWASPDPRGGAR